MSASHILSQASLQSLGCKLWLPLNGDTKDYSGNGNHGTPTGTVYDLKDDGTYACCFDGVDDKISIPSISIGTSPWTVLAWYTPRSFDSYGHILTASTQTDFACKVATSGKYPYFYTSSTGSLAANTLLELDKRYFLAYVYDGSTLKIYIDGDLDVSHTVSGLNIPSTTFTIQGGNSEYANCEQSHTMLFLSALSASGLREIHNATRLIPDKIHMHG
jgi:hypothetical protein